MNTAKKLEFFQSKKSRCLSYDFKGGDLSSEGGLLLLREFDDKLGISQGISECIVDQRHPDYIRWKICYENAYICLCTAIAIVMMRVI